MFLVAPIYEQDENDPDQNNNETVQPAQFFQPRGEPLAEPFQPPAEPGKPEKNEQGQLHQRQEDRKGDQDGKNAKAAQRLGWGMLVLIFFLGAGIAGGLLGAYYENKGYTGKAADCWITVAVSAAAHILAALLTYATC